VNLGRATTAPCAQDAVDGPEVAAGLDERHEGVAHGLECGEAGPAGDALGSDPLIFAGAGVPIPGHPAVSDPVAVLRYV
jgi:hypothetical protein